MQRLGAYGRLKPELRERTRCQAPDLAILVALGEGHVVEEGREEEAADDGHQRHEEQEAQAVGRKDAQVHAGCHAGGEPQQRLLDACDTAPGAGVSLNFQQRLRWESPLVAAAV